MRNSSFRFAFRLLPPHLFVLAISSRPENAALKGGATHSCICCGRGVYRRGYLFRVCWGPHPSRFLRCVRTLRTPAGHHRRAHGMKGVATWRPIRRRKDASPGRNVRPASPQGEGSECLGANRAPGWGRKTLAYGVSHGTACVQTQPSPGGAEDIIPRYTARRTGPRSS
jgi:hypothetical protein